MLIVLNMIIVFWVYGNLVPTLYSKETACGTCLFVARLLILWLTNVVYDILLCFCRDAHDCVWYTHDSMNKYCHNAELHAHIYTIRGQESFPDRERHQCTAYRRVRPPLTKASKLGTKHAHYINVIRLSCDFVCSRGRTEFRQYNHHM